MALTEPTPVPKLVDNANEGALLQYAADSNAAARKANGDKARIRALLHPQTAWQRFTHFFRRK
jgi:hypothetical protein